VRQVTGFSRDGAGVAVATVVAILLFGVSGVLLHFGFYTHDLIADTPLYQHYGNAIVHGRVPYRDFEIDYPPGALPMFAVPALFGTGAAGGVSTGFGRTFETVMWICGTAAIIAMAISLWKVGARPARIWSALLFAAFAPLALGAILLSRFDLWPGALVAVALAALVTDRHRLGSGALGLGVTAKLYPAALLPLALAYTWKRRGRAEAIVCLGIMAGAVALVFLPFVVIAPGGVWQSIGGQLSRPLQIESLGSALLLVAQRTDGVDVTLRTTHGSQNLVGAGPDALATISTVLQVAALVAVWSAFARGPASREALLRGSAAAVSGFVAFGKVLSPQFLIWLIPLVPLARSRLAALLLASALVLTQLWFPFRYWTELVRDLDPTVSSLVLVRDLILVALFALLLSHQFRDARRRAGSGVAATS
jgi:uncharacterized membrane protein